LRAAGIGVPAAVQPDTNVLSLADNLPGLEDGDFPAALREALGVDVLIDNDVNLALLAEVGHGSARDRGNVAFIALGTGIGGALVINGKLLRGAHGGAGEMGYMPLWTIENRGVPGLEERVGEAGIRRFYTAAGGDASHVVRDIFEMAAAGNGPALSTLDTTAEHVARAALTVLALIDPDVIVLGGSIGSRPELIERVRTRVEEANRDRAQPKRWPRGATGRRGIFQSAYARADVRLPSARLTASRFFGIGLSSSGRICAEEDFAWPMFAHRRVSRPISMSTAPNARSNFTKKPLPAR
jgi:predicted NBD/HSP70 family sugar kinase